MSWSSSWSSWNNQSMVDFLWISLCCDSGSNLIVRCCLEQWEVTGKRKNVYWSGKEGRRFGLIEGWTKQELLGWGQLLLWGRNQEQIKSEIGREHPQIELQMAKGIKNVSGLAKSQQSNSDVFYLVFKKGKVLLPKMWASSYFSPLPLISRSHRFCGPLLSSPSLPAESLRGAGQPCSSLAPLVLHNLCLLL